MVRKIFKGKVIATAGSLPGQLTVDNLKAWTKLRGGIYLDKPDETVTHFLCTEEQFNKLKKGPNFRKLLAQRKRLHVLHCDWYEFSCTDNKRLPEKEYSMRNVLAKERAAKREKDRRERGRREAEKFVNTNFFHVYFDREAFPHQITLTRDGEDGETERYELTLWESNAEPHLYQFTAKYLKKKGCSQPSYHRPSPCAGKWRPEIDKLMDFFRIKTGIAWEDRVMLQQTMGTEYFQYKPPTGGKPVGRRLRMDYEECLEINARERGLPWPPVEEEAGMVEKDKNEDEESVDIAEDEEGSDSDDDVDNEEPEEAAEDNLALDTSLEQEGDANPTFEMDDIDSGVSVCESLLDLEDEAITEHIAENEEATDEEMQEGDVSKTTVDSKADMNEDIEMDDGDGGVSVHEATDAGPASSPSTHEYEAEPMEWKEDVQFIDKMNNTLAMAREGVLLADDAILDARDALPGFLQGYLKYY